MQPFMTRLEGTSSPSSPPPTKPLPALPPLRTSPTHRVRTAPSPPVKRKPLPATAFSSPPPPPFLLPLSTASLNLQQQQQQQQELERRQAPSSTSTLHEVFETAGPSATQPLETDASVHPYLHARTDSAQTTGSVSIHDFPVPPQVDHRPFPASDEHITDDQEEVTMGQRTHERPPPLRMDSVNSVKALDTKRPQSPGGKFSSFFMRKSMASPGAESSATEISDGKSAMPSPYPASVHSSNNSALGGYFGSDRQSTSPPPRDGVPYDTSTEFCARSSADMWSRCNALEAELREISTELARSIRRELDLEDLVERLQSETQVGGVAADRTSDYFSDSGTSSLRASGSELSAKEEIDKIKRESEQQRATLRVELSQKWQDEVTQRKTLESHVQLLESRLSQSRNSTQSTGDVNVRVRELEVSVEDARRRLNEEKQTKENFEELVTALRLELEQHRNSKDSMRTDMGRLQQEIQYLKDENTALSSAREMERGLQQNSMNFIAEEDDLVASPRSATTPRIGGLSRSNTIHAGRGNRSSLNRTGSLSRANSTANRHAIDDNAAEKVKAVEQQRDALHTTVKYLLKRQEQCQRKQQKRIRVLEAEIERAGNTAGTRRGDYEREVRVLRAEINTLRKRADDALDQKWQCEKGLAGLKMDLDRNKQETAGLQKLLQVRDSDPDSQELMSATLEIAVVELQKERARTQESVANLEQEQRLVDQLDESATRAEALAAQVKKQLQANLGLRSRLKNAVEVGEQNQAASTQQINLLQNKLRKLEDTINAAQFQSESVVMKHEEDIRVLKASHNASLLRVQTGRKSVNLLSPMPRSPLSPLYANAKRSPRIDNTSSGPGIALNEALRTEALEAKVTELERALADAENEMGEVVSRMNSAQIGVAELQSERDEALRQTRRLEEAVQEERDRYKVLITTLNEW